ncbi:MAG: cbb3-type cytochrome c oxidase subunit I [Chloroflexi bacterium]|nr:cbb3-type cytochrome c oxidase subunit I [Chloroflexota bacterium]
MKKIKGLMSLGIVKGVIAGVLGTVFGAGLTWLLRVLTGASPAYSPAVVWTIGILVGLVFYFVALGAFNYWAGWAVGSQAGEGVVPSKCWRRYLGFDTNHKIIGVQYGVTSLLFFPFAVSLQLLGRLHMSKLGINLDAGTYMSLISDHATVMLFIVVLPGIGAMMNYLVPLMVGARDMAFPRLNALSFWLVPPAGALMVLGLAFGGFDTGWTLYPPLSSKFEPFGFNLVLLGVYVAGFSSILGAINLLTTIFTMRAPGMRLFRMPVFIWSTLATVLLALTFTQFVGIAGLLVLLERVMGTGFFSPGMGGNVVLYQHLFWFYSHPAVYIFVLPGLGVVSHILPVMAGKPLFGYKMVSLSSLGIALGGSLVWGHHMFAAGMEGWLRIPFMFTTLLVAVPTGVKIFSWLATMWEGRIKLTSAFLFVLTAIVVFLIGGLTGVPQGVVPVDLYLTDTYWIVAHFHATLFGGFMFPLMAAIYFWFPKVTGRMLSEAWGKAQWALMSLGSLLLIVPLFGAGLQGMRRRVADYDPASGMAVYHQLSAVGGFLIFFGLVLLAVNIVQSARKGKVAGSNPWQAETLEWLVSSPPPEENFAAPPQVIGQPHQIGVEGAVHAVVKNEALGSSRG